MPSVQYRRAKTFDVPGLAELRGEDEAGGASADRMSRYLAGHHHPRHALPPRAMWLAAHRDVPIGYVAGHLTRRYQCDGELQWLYVVPPHRGLGIATRLVSLLAEWFVQQGAVRVCVDVGDDRARPFYRRLGAIDLNPHWMVWDDISHVVASS